jgi:hypothetical protein
MLALDELVQRIPALRYVDHSMQGTERSRPVIGLKSADQMLRTSTLPRQAPNPPLPFGSDIASQVLSSRSDAPWWQDAEHCAPAVQAFARAGASAILILPGQESFKDGDGVSGPILARAARRFQLPLITTRTDSRDPAENVLASISRTIAVSNAEDESEFLQYLMQELRQTDRRRGGDLRALTERTARVLGGDVTVIAPDGTMTGGDRTTWAHARFSDPLRRIREGSMGAASLEHGGRHIQLMAIGGRTPRSVLAVQRNTPHPSHLTPLISATATVLAARDKLAASRQTERELQKTLPLARLGLFHELMHGHRKEARELGAAVVPGLFDCTHASVFVLECPAARRAAVLDACETGLCSVLAVADPANDRRVVVVAPAPSGIDAQGSRERLKRIADRHGCSMGGSRPMPLPYLHEARSMAGLALVVARRTSDRVVLHSGARPLAHVLDASAVAWARSFLSPLSGLSPEERQRIAETLHQALQLGGTGAAECLGLNRRTIADHCKRAGSLLRLDLRQMENRAITDLALQLAMRPAAGPQVPPAPRFADVIASPAAREWAHVLLRRLRGDTRPLLRTIHGWIASNGRVNDCARNLDLHSNTVRNHLAACEALLGRRLMGRHGGAHEVLLAMWISEGALPGGPALPPRKATTAPGNGPWPTSDPRRGDHEPRPTVQ